jgi:aminopeptidase N
VKRLRIAAAHARDFAVVTGRMAVNSTRTANGIRLTRYRLPSASRADALRTLALARAAVEQYSAWYGDPGEREIDLVAAPSSLGAFGGGMEFPGLVLTSDEPRLVAHELAHQWWYGLVGDDQWRSPWLDESFAEYAARQLPADPFGQDDLSCDPGDPVTPFGKGPLTADMRHWDAAGADAYFRTIYLGGTCALRSLEADLGADWMLAFLRSYADGHRYGVTSTADFVAAVRAAAPPGYDVDAFLRRARIEVP